MLGGFGTVRDDVRSTTPVAFQVLPPCRCVRAARLVPIGVGVVITAPVPSAVEATGVGTTPIVTAVRDVLLVLTAWSAWSSLTVTLLVTRIPNSCCHFWRLEIGRDEVSEVVLDALSELEDGEVS